MRRGSDGIGDVKKCHNRNKGLSVLIIYCLPDNLTNDLTGLTAALLSSLPCRKKSILRHLSEYQTDGILERIEIALRIMFT